MAKILLKIKTASVDQLLLTSRSLLLKSLLVLATGFMLSACSPKDNEVTGDQGHAHTDSAAEHTDDRDHGDSAHEHDQEATPETEAFYGDEAETTATSSSASAFETETSEHSHDAEHDHDHDH